jgi:hypothetical protein
MAFQVQRNGALVAVQGKVDRAHPGMQRDAVGTHQVSFGGLDFNHVSTVVTENLCRERAKYDGCQVQDSYAVERSTAHLLGQNVGIVFHKNLDSVAVKDRQASFGHCSNAFTKIRCWELSKLDLEFALIRFNDLISKPEPHRFTRRFDREWG